LKKIYETSSIRKDLTLQQPNTMIVLSAVSTENTGRSSWTTEFCRLMVIEKSGAEVSK
jgi:hypothetical protein